MQRRNRIPIAALAAAAVTLAALASCTRKAAEDNVFIDPQFASLVPPDTISLVGLRVENLVKTPIYQKYLRGGTVPAIDRFARATGINPEKSLWNLLWVSNGRDSFVLGRGKFADELMAPDFSKKGVERFGYRGLTLFGDDQQAMLLVNSSTIAMGETATLRRLVDQRPSLTGIPARLSALTKEVPRQTQFWGVSAGGPMALALPGNLANVDKILSLVGGGFFYFDLSAGVNGALTGIAVNTQEAQQAHDSVAGLLALGRAMSPKQQPDLARAIDGIKVTQDGVRVTVTIAEPEEQAGMLAKMFFK